MNRLCLYEPFVLPDPADDESPENFDGRIAEQSQQEQPVRFEDGARSMSDDENVEGRALFVRVEC